MTISIVICFGRYMFGSRYFAFLDIGSDTVYDYQTKWFSMADDFHTGHVAQWTLNNGLGASVLAQASWLDPFLWPTAVGLSPVRLSCGPDIRRPMQGLEAADFARYKVL